MQRNRHTHLSRLVKKTSNKTTRRSSAGEGRERGNLGCFRRFTHEVRVVVDVWPVDGQPTVSVRVYSPNIVYNTIVNNGNFDKRDRRVLDRMHKVHFHVRTDQYRARAEDEQKKREKETLTNLWKQSHLMSMAPAATARI